MYDTRSSTISRSRLPKHVPVHTCALQAILDKAMAKEPRDRYQKITELRDELRESAARHFHERAISKSRAAPGATSLGSSPVSRAMRG
jgi:hypothetical protein